MLIAYTLDKVIMGRRKAGDMVNLEVDQMGKYVASSVVSMLENKESVVYKLVEGIVKDMIKG